MKKIVLSDPPCEAHPAPVDGRACGGCAWSPESVGSASDGRRHLVVVRTSEVYGCVRQGAAIVVDLVEERPFMQLGGELLPLSPRYGGVIAGSRLEADITNALARKEALTAVAAA